MKSLAILFMSLAFCETILGAVPHFVSPPSGNGTVSIVEGGTGRTVYNVTATDTDKGVITYSLVSQKPATTPAVFSFTNGIVKTAKEIDFEANTPKAFTLLISATSDHATTDTATATVTVNITDAKPTFSSTSYCAVVASNATKGTVVGTYNATDGDATQNIVSSYTIASGDDAANKKFNVSAAGLLTTTGKKFDKAVKSMYSLVVTASDGKNTGMTRVNITLDGSCDSNKNKKNKDSGNSGNTIQFYTAVAGCMFLLLQII